MNKKIPTIIELPKLEQEKFDALIKKYRDKYIRPSSEIVDLVLSEDKEFLELIKSKQMSLYILKLREKVWQEDFYWSWDCFISCCSNKSWTLFVFFQRNKLGRFVGN